MSRRWLWALILLVILGGCLAAHGIWLPHLACWLDVSEAPQRAEYAMIMGGGVENRSVVAAVLWRKGWVERILVSEIKPRESAVPSFTPPEHELTRAMLIRLGVPPDRIVLLKGNHAATFHEIASLSELLRRRPDTRILIVTDSLHTRRTAWSVRLLLGTAAERVSFVGAPSERYDVRRWWQSADGFFMVTSEYIKIFSYWVVYGSGKWWVPISVCLVGLLSLLWRRLSHRKELATTAPSQK